MATNASRIFLIKWGDKGKVAYDVSKLKTQGSMKSNIPTYVIYIVTSFINSETTALLHLTSFTEDVTNIGFHMPIASIWNPGECPAQWYLGQFIGLIQNPVKHLGKNFGRNS